MSKYTTEVRFICEQVAGYEESQGYNNVADIISRSRSGIFNFEYPIFDESYRATLETKILKHYYTREIGAETVGLWRLWLDRKMNEIMPYYNQLYKSALIEFNPMYDTDYTRTGNRESGKTGETTGVRVENSTVNDVTTNVAESQDSGTDRVNIKDTPHNDRWDYYSDTPQGAVTDLANLDYLTNARHIVDDGAGSNRDDVTTYGKKNVTEVNGTADRTGESTANSRGTENVLTEDEYAERVLGKVGTASYSKMLQEFRETFLNIDMMVIESLSDLFLNLW